MAVDKRAYTKTLNDIARRFTNLEGETVQRALDLLRELRGQIAAELTGTEGFSAFRLREMQRAIERMIVDFESQLSGAFAGAINGSYNLGVSSVVEPLQAAGIQGVFSQFSRAQLAVVLDFSADLIRNIGAEALQRINTQIGLAALGQHSPFDTMRDVTKILGVRRDKVTGIAYRAESTVRTELQRTFNLASHSQQLATAEQIPDIRKRWIATGDSRTRESHLRVHLETKENPIPVDKPFKVGLAFLMYPLDPAGPAKETINCRCRQVTIHSELGVIASPLDKRIEQQLERRQESVYA